MSQQESAPFHTVTGDYGRGVVLIGDHASNRIPPELNQLGLGADDLARHIAWDIGTDAITRRLASRFRIPATICGTSRLVIDSNRHPTDSASIPAVSDGTPIPGNQHLTVWQRTERIARWFTPYHDAIASMMQAALEARPDTVVVSIHSMTDEMRGIKRPWSIALSSHEDRRLAEPMLAALRRRVGPAVGDNEPYPLDPAEDYSVPVHAMKRGLRHLQVEFRQDLVADGAGVDHWGGLFGDALQEILAI